MKKQDILEINPKDVGVRFNPKGGPIFLETEISPDEIRVLSLYIRKKNGGNPPHTEEVV